MLPHVNVRSHSRSLKPPQAKELVPRHRGLAADTAPAAIVSLQFLVQSSLLV